MATIQYHIVEIKLLPILPSLILLLKLLLDVGETKRLSASFTNSSSNTFTSSSSLLAIRNWTPTFAFTFNSASILFSWF